MKRKGIFTILMAAFMVLAFSAMALAANNVRLTTTVPNIPKSTCYQAGTDTFEFDTGTAIAERDVIQVTLNNKVTVCKTINMFVTVNAANSVVLETSADAPIATTAGSVTATGVGTGRWGFLVQAATGSQIITATLQIRYADGSLVPSAARVMTFTGAVAADKLIMKLFDSKIGFGTSLIFKPLVGTPTLYDTAIVAADNILCIDTLTQDFPDEYVQNTPDSLPVLAINKLFFSGDYRIAHIMTAQTFNLVTCKGATCGHIVLGTGGQNATCRSFDYEVNPGAAANGYCSDHKADTGYLPKFIIQTSQPFDLVPYTVKAEILVNNVAGDHGVYWSNTAPRYTTSAATLCNGVSAGALFAGQTYADAAGAAVLVGALLPPGANNCAAVTTGKAVSFTTTAGLLFAAGDVFFELNLPDFVYNAASVNVGDVVSVRVTLNKGTCGTVTLDLCIGTFGCGAVPVIGSAILCPYVTSLHAGDSFWNGIAIANTSTTAAGTVLLTAYKQDGTTATFTTPSIPAGGMYKSVVGSGVTPDIVWTGTTPAEVPAFIRATSSTIPAGSLEAFVMIGQAKDPGDSMGYLCK